MKKTKVLFASAALEKMDRDVTLPAKFMRLLDRLPIQKRVKGKTVAIKMHVGGDIGFSTIHPLFVKLLVDHVRKGKPKRIFITDQSVKGASDRGYAENTVGAPLVATIGKDGKDVVEEKTGWNHLPAVLIGRPILEADVLINFSHVKGHGDCGFGGACKNLAMGCVPPKSRRDMHSLEGKLTWTRNKCIRCNKCLKECTTKANSFNKKGEYEIFWHDCRMCLHCMLVCPTGAIKIEKPRFDLFQEALARVTKCVLNHFEPKNVFHINVLNHITIFCDCWGLTTPAVVPDIGIFAGQDLVAIDHASLKSIRTKDLLPSGVPPPFKLGGKKDQHLFHRIHGKDPFQQIRSLERLGAGTTRYAVEVVK